MGKVVRIFIAFVLLLGLVPKFTFAEETSKFDSDLETYSKEISGVRGFPVTKDDIESSLSNYNKTLADFSSVDGPDGLKEFLGEVIKSDYSNLAYMKDDYDLTIDQVTSLLKENGEDIKDYVFVDDLDQAVYFYLYPDESGSGDQINQDFINGLVTMLQDEFGLTNLEITNLKNHFKGLGEKLSTPEATIQLENLGQRLEAFQNFNTINELSPGQIQELLSIYNELTSMLELKVDLTLVKGDKETTLTLIDLLKMTELVNAKLKVTISDLKGNFLADLVVTGDMVDSQTVKKVGKDINTAADKVQEVVKEKPIIKHNLTGKKKVPAAAHLVVKTVKGGELPNTAGNYLLDVLIGILLILGGTGLYRLFRRRIA